VVSVSTIGFVTVLTVWSLFLPLSCNCSYGVVSLSTIGFVTVLTVWSLFLRYSYKPNGRNRDHTGRTVTKPMVETETTPSEQLQSQWYKQRPHWKNSYKLNRRNRDHTIRTVTNPMVETETTPQCGLCFYHWVCDCSYGVVSVSTIGFVTVLTVWSLFIPLGL
jgi:hypothetical protein